MARISTYWDYELKKEAFMIRGDSGYTKSTDCTLTPISMNNSRIEYGVQEFTVEVVGDRGASNIIIYDNDEPILVTIDGQEMQSIEWDTSKTNVSFTCNLNYGVDHNIRARYLGNDRCLGSKSRLITINEPMPDLYTTTLQRYNDTTVNYTPNTAFTLPIEFISGQTLLNTETKTIECFIDDDSQGTTDITISANTNRGNANISVDGLTEGTHNIRLEFDGDEHSSQTSFSFQISVGYIISIISYSPYSVNFENVHITARLLNYLGQGIPNQTVNSGTTDSEGYVYFDFPYPHEPSYVVSERKWIWRLSSIIDDVTYYSEYMTILLYPNVSVSLSADTLITCENRQSTVTATVSGTTNPIPVTFTGAISGTYTSSEDGLIVKQYNGVGAGNVTVTASIYDSSSSLTIEDVLQYWRANNVSYNQSYTVQSGTFQELTNGYKLPSGSSINVNMDLSEDFEVTFHIVQGNSVYDRTTTDGYHTITQRVTYNNIPIYILFPGLNNSFTVATGDTIKFSHINGEYILYRNNEVFVTIEASISGSALPIATITPTPSSLMESFVSGYILFNNLKIKRL